MTGSSKVNGELRRETGNSPKPNAVESIQNSTVFPVSPPRSRDVAFPRMAPSRVGFDRRNSKHASRYAAPVNPATRPRKSSASLPASSAPGVGGEGRVGADRTGRERKRGDPPRTRAIRADPGKSRGCLAASSSSPRIPLGGASERDETPLESLSRSALQLRSRGTMGSIPRWGINPVIPWHL